MIRFTCRITLLPALFVLSFLFFSCGNSKESAQSSKSGEFNSRDLPLDPAPLAYRSTGKPKKEAPAPPTEVPSSTRSNGSPALVSSSTPSSSGGGLSDIQDNPLSPPPVKLVENGFRAIGGSPFSTFSIDVDAASYTNTRGYLSRDRLPPVEAVRIEELINYFHYDYKEPTGDHPFSFATEASECPWDTRHRLVRIALQGYKLHPEQAPSCNLVFLVDVSGSMDKDNKLPLLKEGFYKLVDQLRAQDRVAIVVYAGAAGLVLESTSGSKKEKIKKALADLDAGGSTAGGEGIELAYKVAKDSFLKKGNNRVILATDGDFNVGVSSEKDLVKLIEEKRNDGIFLSVLGFGNGNYKDREMEQLADNGNGNYYYIDGLKEAERVLVSEMSGTLNTIAKDVKLQIEFNPAKVAAYRLIGYENRVLAARDFNDDAKDAGELGAGHTVTAFYEIVPVGTEVGYELDTTKLADYRLPDSGPNLFSASDLMIARLRYKKPEDTTSVLIEHLIADNRKPVADASTDFRFAAAVAEWGMLLLGSEYKGTASFEHVIKLAKDAKGKDEEGYRKEFVEIVEKTKELSEKSLSTR